MRLKRHAWFETYFCRSNAQVSHCILWSLQTFGSAEIYNIVTRAGFVREVRGLTPRRYGWPITKDQKSVRVVTWTPQGHIVEIMDKIVFHRCQNASASGGRRPQTPFWGCPKPLIGALPWTPLGTSSSITRPLPLTHTAIISQIQHWFWPTEHRKALAHCVLLVCHYAEFNHTYCSVNISIRWTLAFNSIGDYLFSFI